MTPMRKALGSSLVVLAVLAGALPASAQVLRGGPTCAPASARVPEWNAGRVNEPMRVPSVDPLSTLLRRRSAAGTLDALLQEASVVAAAGISVPVYVHVLYSSRTNTPNVTEAQITSQISVLNASYGGQNVGAANPLPDGNNANAGVTFTLSDATPTTTGLIDFQIGRAHV